MPPLPHARSAATSPTQLRGRPTTSREPRSSRDRAALSPRARRRGRPGSSGAKIGVRHFVAAARWQSHESHNALKHNGQRWWALAVSDYESRALPLSYGGGGPKVSEGLLDAVLDCPGAAYGRAPRISVLARATIRSRARPTRR